MKKAILFFCLLFIYKNSFEQVLLEERDGDQIVRFRNGQVGALSLIKLNTGEQSLGFSYIITNKLKDANKYCIHDFTIKAKPTEGYATVFSTGQFSPGIKISYALTKVNIFGSNTNWGGIFVSYDRDKYLLFNSSNSFQSQIYSKNFNGFKASLNFNKLLKSIWIFAASGAFERKNNFEDLTLVEIRDINTISDPSTLTEREVIKTKKPKIGTLESFNSFPVVISLTRATQTDGKDTPEEKRLRLGYTGYIKNQASSNSVPNTDVGLIVFLTKQNENGIRNPVFGMEIKVNNIFKVQDKDNVFFNKIEVGFTTNFSL